MHQRNALTSRWPCWRYAAKNPRPEENVFDAGNPALWVARTIHQKLEWLGFPRGLDKPVPGTCDKSLWHVSWHQNISNIRNFHLPSPGMLFLVNYIMNFWRLFEAFLHGTSHTLKHTPSPRPRPLDSLLAWPSPLPPWCLTTLVESVQSHRLSPHIQDMQRGVKLTQKDTAMWMHGTLTIPLKKTESLVRPVTWGAFFSCFALGFGFALAFLSGRFSGILLTKRP